MKNRELLIANIILVGIIAFFSIITFNIFSNQSFRELINDTTSRVIQSDSITPILNLKCSSKDVLNLVPEDDEHILKLAEYQENCESYATDTLMFFTSFPYDNESSTELAFQISEKLKLFQKNNINPIVIVEPYIGDKELEYKAFMEGEFDKFLDYFFSELKVRGINDELMGMWVPFPESNTPNWANKDTEPSDFGKVVNRYLGVLKSHFPKAHGSILLNATTYEPNDLEWNNGDYISLSQYLVEIDRGLVDSFGIQGFPWASDAIRNDREIFRASEFLQPDIAIAAAQELRTRDIWLNTGSFYTKYTNDEDRKIFVSLNDRKAILTGILDVAKYIKNYQLNEYRVKINLFSEDKSNFNEATDWSYFQNEDSIDVLKEFMSQAEFEAISVTLFDRLNNKF